MYNEVKNCNILRYQGNEKMVEDEIDGYDRHDCLASAQHRLVHDFDPSFLRQDLKHGHESLCDILCKCKCQLITKSIS